MDASFKNKIFNLIFACLLLVIVGSCVSLKITNQWVFIIWCISIVQLLHFFNIFVLKTFKNIKYNIKNIFSIPVTVLLFVFLGMRSISFIDAKILRSHHDETIMTYWSDVLFQDFLKNFNLNMLGQAHGPVSDFPSIWYCLEGFFLWIFGYNIYTSKILSLLTDILIFGGIWYYTKYILKKNKVAWISMLVYATFSPAIFYSVAMLNNLQASLFFLVTLIVLIINLENKNYKKELFIGLLAGFSFYFYLSSVALLVSIGIFYFYRLLFFKNIKEFWCRFCYFFIGFFFLITPFFMYSIFQYNFIEGRLGGVSVLNQYQEHFFIFFKEQFLRMLIPFYKGFFNGSGMHYVNIGFFNNIFLVIFFLIGFLVSLFKMKEPKYFILVIFFIVNFILGGMMTNNPPASQRFLPIIWLSAIFISISFDFIYSVLKKIFFKTLRCRDKENIFSNILCAFFVIIILCANLKTFNQALDWSKNNQDPSLSFLKVYQNEALKVISKVPPHVPFLLSVYGGMRNFQMFDIESSEAKEILKTKRPHYLLLYFVENGKVFVDPKKYKRIKLPMINNNPNDITYSLYKTL